MSEDKVKVTDDSSLDGLDEDPSKQQSKDAGKHASKLKALK